LGEHHLFIWIMTISSLTDNGFLFVGAWVSIDSKPHKAPWIKYQSGLYAFVLLDEVVYVGKAKVLHRRLRNYSRRAFRDLVRAKRHAHTSISDGVASGVEVHVYAKIMEDADDFALFEAESTLIKELHPIWNRTLLKGDKAI